MGSEEALGAPMLRAVRRKRDLGQQSSNRYRCGACVLRLSGAVAALEAVGFDDLLVCGAFVLGVPGQVQ